MPDWTYIPLRNASSALLGVSRSRASAIGLVSTLAKLPGGPLLIRCFSFTFDHPETSVSIEGNRYSSSIGVELRGTNKGTQPAIQAMGFGFVTSDQDPHVSALRLETTDLEEVAAAITNNNQLVVANNAVIEFGPDTGQRVNEALVCRSRNNTPPPMWFGLRFWQWAGWVWALWLGIAMVCAGIGASIITLGPVLLPYDVDFLGADLAGLDAINARLRPFLQHDRITMAGCMTAIGFNDIGFALAMRRGWRWAKVGFGLAGAFGFPTFFLFLGYEFLDPLHLAVAVGFFPLYVMALIRPSAPPSWVTNLTVSEEARRKALVGQLLLIVVAIGVAVSGVVIMVVGLRDVLIPSDREFLGNTQTYFESQLDGRLLRFVAHDRAGFGGALLSLGIGVGTLAAWGWRENEPSTWWMLLLSSIAGFVPALVVHFHVGYTDFFHLSPAYLGVIMVGIALFFSRHWLLRRTVQ